MSDEKNGRNSHDLIYTVTNDYGAIWYWALCTVDSCDNGALRMMHTIRLPTSESLK